MYKVKIIGAGSIGNHFAHACRQKNWEVWLCDIDGNALERTKNETYKQRYGKWDNAIKLAYPDELAKQTFDLIIIGTPPDTHSEIALSELNKNPPKVLLIEKPLSFSGDKKINALIHAVNKAKTHVLVGYNHHLSQAIDVIKKELANKSIGEIHWIQVDFRENFKYMLKAHPWLKDIADTYLGSNRRGGGAGFEHSHGLALWLYLAEFSGLLPIKTVFASVCTQNSVNNIYDRIFTIHVENSHGCCGYINQDFMTSPPVKRAEIFGEKGIIKWSIVNKDHEEVNIILENDSRVLKIPKQRSQDFLNEIDHIQALIQNKVDDSAVSWERGLLTYKALETAVESIKKRTPISFRKP